MSRSRAAALLVGTSLVLVPTAASADDDERRGSRFGPGAPGIGDPYFPLDGNGGYDVRHYDLDLRYDPTTDVLEGEATITARATQGLSAFNLDLTGLEVRSVEVDGRDATWTRDGDELTVTPARGIRERKRFRVEIRYDGVPQTLDDGLGVSGFIHTDDGAIVAGQPHAADTWFPANDHPTDKASYSFEIEVPEGLQAVANGVLEDRDDADGWTTWEWEAKAPMASYLTVMAIGELDVRRYREDGIRYWDAIDPDTFNAEPRTGDGAAISGEASQTWTRLTRTLDVPAEGAALEFWVARDAEPGWDFMTVEARTPGTDAWTTLPDENGHTTQDTGVVCPFSHELYPFLAHYQTPADTPEGPTCLPTGTTGSWWAATGWSRGYEQWAVDLSAYAGGEVEVSIASVTDDLVEFSGLVVDDVVVSTGEGTTSFEDDGDVLDGWTVTGPPEGSAAPGGSGWAVGTAADVPPSIGEFAEGALARQPEILDFLAGVFGRYPFRAAGGIVTDHEPLGFALETQTRPIYAPAFFRDPVSSDTVVVHELAHQWVGDALAVERWQHIWLNEGFATYSEWLWLEEEGVVTAQEQFDVLPSIIPAADPFWALTIGDPGPDALFDLPVYLRGAMTLHALRLEVGDDAFFEILREWVADQRRDGHVTTPEFVALAEDISGRDLDELFRIWLFTGEKPAGLPEPSPEPEASSSLVAPGPVGPGRDAARLDLRR